MDMISYCKAAAHVGLAERVLPWCTSLSHGWGEKHIIAVEGDVAEAPGRGLLREVGALPGISACDEPKPSGQQSLLLASKYSTCHADRRRKTTSVPVLHGSCAVRWH